MKAKSAHQHKSAHQLWQFAGGIHPPENKSISTQQPILDLPMPDKLVLPLRQQIGAPAQPVVTVGDTVLKGQKIAEGQGFISCPVHAPTSGVVTAISDHAIPHASGMEDTCVVIEPDGQDRWIDKQENPDFVTLKKTELNAIIREAGISGMGGAGFPTAVKTAPRDNIDTLIINAAECEPYITADDVLMRERADEIIEGIEIVARLISPRRILVGIEDNKPQAITAMEKAAAGTSVDIVVIPTKYPSGGEKQLIYILTGKEVPSGAIPASIGVVVQNVGTCAAIYRAVRYGEPLISRVTTLTGLAPKHPGNFNVLIGTPVSHLLKTGLQAPVAKLVMGGPMMGFELASDDIPVIKTTNCILAPSKEELGEAIPEQQCIRCGECAKACPANLLPQQLYWHSAAKELDKAESYNLFDCIECGACAYVCPSHIPLVQYYRFAKTEIKVQKADKEKAERAKVRYEQRNARLEEAKRQKEEQRRLRAEKAAKAKAAKAAAAKEAAASGEVQPADAPKKTSQDDDARKAVIEQALARAKAKKAAKQAKPSNDGSATPSATDKAE
jgi:electron transport complex protein RnfC